MKLECFSMFDAKSQLFANPFFSENSATAVRAVEKVVNEKPAQSILAEHPEDFVLYRIGYFENTHGREDSGINRENVPVAICTLSSLVRRSDVPLQAVKNA